MPEQNDYDGDSRVQRDAELLIRSLLEKELHVELSATLPISGPRLDGFADAEQPICVEIWAHQGRAKSAQKNKVMADMCKLVLCEHILGRKCRKIIAVSDQAALSFLQNSWTGQFADTFGIERRVVPIPEEHRTRIREAQKKQYR